MFYEISLWKGSDYGHFLKKMIAHLKGTAGQALQLMI